MSSSGLIRIQQPSSINQNNYLNNSEKHTISIFRLFFHMFNYIYLLNTKLCLYFLLLIKQLLRILFGFWTFIFFTLVRSRKKVKKFKIILNNYLVFLF